MITAAVFTKDLPQRISTTLEISLKAGPLMDSLLLIGTQWQAPAFMLQSGEMSSVRDLSITLFTDFLFPFEVASVILLVALVGAIILTRQEAE